MPALERRRTAGWGWNEQVGGDMATGTERSQPPALYTHGLEVEETRIGQTDVN